MLKDSIFLSLAVAERCSAFLAGFIEIAHLRLGPPQEENKITELRRDISDLYVQDSRHMKGKSYPKS